MKNFPLITKYYSEIGVDVRQADNLFLRILESNLKNVESANWTVDDAVGSAIDEYSEATDNEY